MDNVFFRFVNEYWEDIKALLDSIYAWLLEIAAKIDGQDGQE